MLSRRYMRYVYLALVLSLFCVVALAVPHEFDQVRAPDPGLAEREALDPSPEQFFLTPQEKYHAEIGRYSSLFRDFKSTVKQIQPGTSHNPKLFDDPRVKNGNGGPIPKIFRPYPDYNSDEWRKTHRGTFKACEGVRGRALPDSLEDQVGVYVGIPSGFPKTLFGSHEAIGLDGRLSYDRFSRYGAYGFGEDTTSVENWIRPQKVNWPAVDWGQLQQKCAERNADRYDERSTTANPNIPPESRTAVLIRSYTGKQYSENDMHNIRAMITELSLQSGGEFEVILLVHVKDDAIVLGDEGTHQYLLEENIPQEFWGITKFWNVPMVAARYPNIDPNVIDVHHSQWLPIQQFMLDHPEFEYFWNWEIDSRLTGHHYEFASQVAEFGRRQPRREMWERNERFYIPGYHGDYDTAFRKFVNRQSPKGIWGPMPVKPMDGNFKPLGPSPPVPMASQDNYEWGVGEEADIMGLLPAFNPQMTDWVIRNEVYGYLGPDTPRRATLITHSRLSRRLLMAMDHENLAGRHMGSELFPMSTALLHGFKGISVPHPVYADRVLPANRVSRWYNSGINGRSGSTPDSPFSWGRESRFKEVSWYYRANLPGRLYWNFLGWEKEGTGGPDYEQVYGRVVLPTILFHPIKDVYPDADSTHYEFDADFGIIASPD